MRELKAKSGIGHRGFTIPEVLMVVVIIGLIAGSGTGLYVGTFKKMRVQKAAYDLLLAAQYGRIMAIEQNSRCTLMLDSTNNRFWLTRLEWDEESEQASEQIVKDPYCKPVEFEGDVVFEDIQIALVSLETEHEAEEEQQKSIVFSPDGSAQTAAIQIGNGRNHYTVGISAATGRAKLYLGTTEKVKTTSTDLDVES
ncbi:MAG: prepilin-type N-terminal cleavage/methylation domain-containing protein [Phycisphaerales bacterium]|nr:MAG: prepilin-type N-terminal cleavage/methylation domain-containing protein [Phycisphaerales bacterium]